MLIIHAADITSNNSRNMRFYVKSNVFLALTIPLHPSVERHISVGSVHFGSDFVWSRFLGVDIHSALN